MEPGVREFFKRISYSIVVSLLWVAITAIAAIKGDNAFVGSHVTLGNILFYVWLVISIFLLIWALKKIWRNNVVDDAN